MQENGMRVIAMLTTAELEDREHFGFRDGIAQPHLANLQKGAERDAVQFGELVLGYINEYGRRTPRPLIDDAAAALPADAGGSGKRDLARNGTYLVFRQLRQDVRAFWDFCEGATRAPDGSVDEPLRLKLAAKLIGRWPSGAPLALAPEADRPELKDSNDFEYFQRDRYGIACPVGAHVRRANPRDMLEPAPGTSRSIAVNKRHRLLRRGRKYGPLLSRDALVTAGTDATWDAPERGIHFICLGANISRQFEFVQHSWLIDPRFNGAHEQVDPLIGPAPEGGRTFTVRATPVRTRYSGLPSFVQVRGGAYFFLPGYGRCATWRHSHSQAAAVPGDDNSRQPNARHAGRRPRPTCGQSISSSGAATARATSTACTYWSPRRCARCCVQRRYRIRRSSPRSTSTSRASTSKRCRALRAVRRRRRPPGGRCSRRARIAAWRRSSSRSPA